MIREHSSSLANVMKRGRISGREEAGGGSGRDKAEKK
jgi:hypothetical protein